MRCLPSFIDGMGPAGGVAGAGDLGLVAVGFVASSFLASLGRGKKAVYKTDFEKGFIFFFNQKKEVAPTTSSVGFSSPSLFVVVLLLLLLTHIVRFPCGGRGCSKRVGAVTVRQDTSALPHASRVLGWAMGQGSIPPPRTFWGPARCTQHQRRAFFAMQKLGRKYFCGHLSICGQCSPSHPINTLPGVLIVHCKKLRSPGGHGPKPCHKVQPHPLPVPLPSPAAAGSPRKFCSGLRRDEKGVFSLEGSLLLFKRLHRNSLNSLKLKDLKPTTKK